MIYLNAANMRPASADWFTTSPPEDFTQEEKERLFWELGYLQQRIV